MNASTADIKKAIRAPYAWPGGYPLFFLTDDCAALCKTCARSEWPQICAAVRSGASDGWRVVAIDINWEDNTLTCDHCGNPIESAYGE